MFPLLTIEGSSQNLSVALFRNAVDFRLIQSPPDGLSHSEKILVLIDRLLKEENLALSELKAIGVPRGPGSFTSLRIGLATVMGFAAGLNISLYTCSSLAVIALKAGEGLWAPFLKAGRGQVYCAGFRVSLQNLDVKLEETVLMPDEFMHQVKKFNLIPCGPEPSMISEGRVCEVIPDAATVGRLIISNPVRLDVNQLEVNYLKTPDLGGK